MINSIFTDNAAKHAAGVYWKGYRGILSGSNFTNNVASGDGGAVCWSGSSGRVFDSIFINNTANQGGAFYGSSGSYYLTLTTSTFINNTANSSGGIRSEGHDSIFSDCTFTGNSAIHGYGGAAYMGTNGANNILTGCTFDNNIASSSGGAIYFSNTGSIINCSFNNKNWIKSNGISAGGNLKIDGGKGIVDIVTSNTISGISIVVLNNETYYYPPNTNINLTKKKKNMSYQNI